MRKCVWKHQREIFQKYLWIRALGFYVVAPLLWNQLFYWQKKKQKKPRKQQQNQTTKTPRKITNNWFYDHPPVEIQATLPSRYCCVCGRLLLKSIERKAVLLKLWCQGVWIPKNVGRKGAAKRKLKEIVLIFLTISYVKMLVGSAVHCDQR